LTGGAGVVYAENMISALRKELRLRIVVLVFVFYTVWWLILQVSDQTDTVFSDLFSDTYGITALLGFLIGYFISKSWGGWNSKMGRAMLMFSFGLLAQAFGQFTYTAYYLLQGIDAPYPSIGDIGYFGSIFFYIYGVILLAKASGISVSLKKFENQIKAVLFPILLLGISYVIFLKDYDISETGPITTLLDFGYPLGQTVYLSLALLTYLLSRKILGGVMRTRILYILFALFLQYVAILL